MHEAYLLVKEVGFTLSDVKGMSGSDRITYLQFLAQDKKKEAELLDKIPT